KLNASATHGQVEIKSFQSERLSLKSDLSQLRQKLAATEAELRSDAEAWHAETTRLEAETATLSEHLTRGQEEIEALRLALRAREIEDSETQGRLHDVQAERMAAFRDIETLRQSMGSLEMQLDEAKVDRAQFVETGAKLRQAESDLAVAKDRFSTAERQIADLEARAQELEEEAGTLRRNLKKGQAGKELLELQGRHAEVKAERDSLAGQVRQMTTDLEARETLRGAAVMEAKEMRLQLEAALKQLESQSESRLRADNDVLRGIVTRQNSELEQRHLKLVRLKRAQIALRLVYALFGLGFILLGIFAVKLIPALRF
ncbi:MAG: hypothetical protein ABI680_15175, partial [Chthoniobacteraceae bacterium]